MFIVKIPGINGENSKGCERSGEAIIKELRKIHANEQGKPIDVDLLDLEEIHLDNSNLELTNKLIYENSLEIFETKPKTIFLGGDGSISFSVCRAFMEHCKNSGKEPCLIIFDAHADCCENKKVFPTNRQWLRALIEYGFPPENALLVGIRNINNNEGMFLKDKKIKMFSIDSLTEDLHEACDTIMEFTNNKEVYVSIDIDAIDPAFAPSVNSPEPCGLNSRDFLHIIKRLNKIKNLKALDIVEINEQEDMKNNGSTIKLGAKILSEII